MGGLMSGFSIHDVTWVMEDADLRWLEEYIATATEVCIDLETTGLNEHAKGARVVLASITLPQDDDAGEPSTAVVPLSHPESPWIGQWQKVLWRIAVAIRDSRRPVWNHNMKFDARWVYAHTGVDLSRLIEWDSVVSSHLLDETRTSRLKDRVVSTFGIERWDDFDLSSEGAAERVPLFDLGFYAARDTYWAWRLAKHHQALLFINSAEHPVGREEVSMARLGRLATWAGMPTVRVLTAIEQRGVLVDREWVTRELAEHRENAAVLTKELAHLYPHAVNPDEPSFAPTSHWFRDWTQAAVEAGDLTVAELTPTGKPRWSKGVLRRQARAGSETAEALLNLRGLNKRAEYLSSWLGLMSAGDRIHATYHAGFVATGRLSSSGPNMQQVTAALKPAFVPSPGHVFVDLDYSQIELRVAAFISRSEPMIEAFQRGDDLHARLAARITGKAEADVTPAERQAGKSANFGLLYGMGAYGFKMYAEDVYGVVLTSDEASRAYHAFFDTWDGIAQWHARMTKAVMRDGEVTSPIGRVRRLPGGWDSNPEVAGGAVRAGINSPVQGLASDLMQMAAASIEGVLPMSTAVEGARIVATVHDSILIEVPTQRWREVAEACRDRMLSVTTVLKDRFEVDFDVPLAVDGKVGTRWGLDDVGHV